MREAEDAEPAAFERRVENVARIGDHVLAFKDSQTDQVDFRPMEQEPPVGDLLLPADVARVLPQQFHLRVRVAGVPQRVAHHLTRPGVRFDQLQLNAGLGNGAERRRLPVGLRVLLPHDRIKMSVVLVAGDDV